MSDADVLGRVGIKARMAYYFIKVHHLEHFATSFYYDYEMSKSWGSDHVSK